MLRTLTAISRSHSASVVLVQRLDVHDSCAVDDDLQDRRSARPSARCSAGPDPPTRRHTAGRRLRRRRSESHLPACAPDSSCTSTIATLAPSVANSRTVASPMPDAPPLTQAVCPRRRPLMAWLPASAASTSRGSRDGSNTSGFTTPSGRSCRASATIPRQTVRPMSRNSSSVQAMQCGASRTLSSSPNRWGDTTGSSAKQSMAAPAIRRSRNAA